MNKETVIYYSCWFQEYFGAQGMDADLAIFLNVLINCILLVIVVLILDWIARRFLIEGFKAFSQRTETKFDDYLVLSNFPKYIAHFLPLTVIWYMVPIIFLEYPILESLILQTIDIYVIILGVLVVRSILRTSKNYFETKEKYHDKPLQSYVQILMIFSWGIAVFLIINILTGYSLVSLTTLGAASAILLLIFKDTILGFVASIQVSVNDIVRLGDWITFSKFGADGYVTEINLATVRVQNFDNTFTTIPTYSLIADSFQNWRGMQESPGRRIKRSIFIKQTSIKFLSAEELEELKHIQLIEPYIEHREREVDRFNKVKEANKKLLINGRNQTNLGVFRRYAESYLVENELINPDLFLMVRHLAPTDKGIPIEIFCFTYDKKWENYEQIQADIFDHLLAAVSYFGLEVFELPTGKDFSSKMPPEA
ncbi:mechanosensitive ion channel family protein [Cochleicola gelatinilyticus]|uniref:Mechanosensitive ion channel protein MscS n=1 Tax=Cochleicola gelatinilyticus TaxID=1763537 RepID=A0A167GZD2_9FLAO|nr:mechanosensitive ion channel domain-containing protein [Cochleicola gelatinilyticus]OAB78054.1 mechanosensitive ion channel protein MscS [Cochleicola gelatinilyticus]